MKREFNVIVKELRNEKNMTQQDVANVLDITRPAYARYEIGDRQPTYDNIATLAALFNVSIDYLLGYSERRELNEMELVKIKLPVYKGLKNINDFGNDELIVAYRERIGEMLDGDAVDYFYHKVCDSNLVIKGVFMDSYVLVKKTNDFGEFEDGDICLASVNDEDATLYSIVVNDDMVSLVNQGNQLALKKYQVNLLGIAISTEKDLKKRK